MMPAAADHVTIATSTGLLWLALVVHFGSGLTALGAGVAALAAAKGGVAHKRSGIFFTNAIIVAGLLASFISVHEGKSAASGFFMPHFVVTATTTVGPPLRHARAVSLTLMVLAFTLAAGQGWSGVVAWNSPGHMMAGVPAAMIFFLATTTLLAAAGDLRMIRAGGISGSRRVARHLWRMCFALFIATGSFFIGQMKFVPRPIRIVPLLFALGLAPLFALLYWMWRVRMRARLSGIVIGDCAAASQSRYHIPARQ